MDNIIDTLEKVSTTVTGEPVKITVSISPRNWLHEKLQNHSWSSRFFPRERSFQMHPIKMGSLVRISKLLLTIDKDLFSQDTIMQDNYEALQRHHLTIARIIATAIHNRKSEVPESLVQLIVDEFTMPELLAVVALVLKQMDLKSFMISITSIRGLNVLESRNASAKSVGAEEVSPLNQGSLIAPGM